MKKNIAIVAGGNSSEYTISINSAKELRLVLNPEKYNVYTVLIQESKWTVIENNREFSINKNDFSFKLNDGIIHFDCILMAIHGTPGEDGKLQSYFDLVGIPYTSCSANISALTFNKFACKAFLKEFGTNTAKSLLLRKNEPFDIRDIQDKLNFPCFVKPNNSGSSFGISKVNDGEGLRTAIFNAFIEDDEVIIEEFVDGTEISCGLVKVKGKTHIFPLTEIISKNEFFDYEAKYTGGKAEEITPARIPGDISQRCKELSSSIYTNLGCRGIVRIDYIISGNTPYFLEINTVPGMTAESIVPKQIISYGKEIGAILDLVIEDTLIQH